MTLTEFFEKESSKNFHMEDCFFKQILAETGLTPQLILESSILDRYQSLIRRFLVKVKVNEKQRYNYQFNPKKIAYQMYDNTEYWFLVLQANELFSAMDLTLDKGYIMLYQNGIQQTINEIMNVEKKYIQKNAAEISSFITSQK